MWSPTHIQVTVQRAKGLLTKGKNGTNNCFVTIAVGKEKYQTSVKEKAVGNVEWHEECELTIPDKGNRAELNLTCLHRNNMSIDEFLGQITLPLNEMDVYDRPRSKWYKLESKPGKDKKKDRGELEFRVSFIVKSGSLSDLSKKEKHKSSIGQLASSVGGSLLSIGTLEKRKGIKKFAKSLGSKMHINSKKKGKEPGDNDSFNGSFNSIGTSNSLANSSRFGQRLGDADPGVISEDEDEFVFDNLSHKSSGSSINLRGIHNQRIHTPSPLLAKEDKNLQSRTLPPVKPRRNTSDQKLDEWESKLYGKHLDVGSTDSLKRRSWDANRLQLQSEITNVNLKNDSILEVNPSTELIIKKELEEDTGIKSPASNTEINTSIDTNIQSNTAPSTPVFNKSKENLTTASLDEENGMDMLIHLPRSATMENLNDGLSPTDQEFEFKEKPDKKSKFTSKLKYFKRDKSEPIDDQIFKPKPSERTVIGHESNIRHDSRTKISKELMMKYEGKTREDLMLIAHGMEHDVLIQRQKVKELEDYLDNLLLRVMETHPPILQNPYAQRTTSTKSG